MILTIDKRGSKIDRNSIFAIAICRQPGDKWQLKTLFLTIFDLGSSIVLTFSIAAYQVCIRDQQVTCRSSFEQILY